MDLEEFRNILEKNHDILLELYNISDTENLKNGALNQSVGVSREMDFVAFITYFLKIKSVEYYFSNKYQYDVSIQGKKYSIKHQTGDANSGIKFKWSSTTDTYLNRFIFDYHLIIVSINRENNDIIKKYKEQKTLKIYIIFSDILNKLIRKFKRFRYDIFLNDYKSVSFSAQFIKEVKENAWIYKVESNLLKRIDKSDKALDFRLATIHYLVKGIDIPHKLSKNAFKI